jgi:hypothetical protein
MGILKIKILKVKIRHVTGLYALRSLWSLGRKQPERYAKYGLNWLKILNKKLLQKYIDKIIKM